MSKQATSYRAMLYLCTLAGFACFYAAYKGSQGLISKGMGLSVGLLGVACLFIGAWYGWKGAQIRIAEREKKADAVALVMMAAFLKDKTEDELTAAAKKGGPVGEAARLILERRKSGLRPSGTQATQ